MYSDFTVRFKFRVVKGNSGFYFRSEKVARGVGVHGFQAEVENSNKVAGLYETGKRGWVKQPDAELIKGLYKPGKWNAMSVTAIGRHVVVQLNGTKTVELKDDPGRLVGHFALQLHGGMDMEVMFKDVEIRNEKPAAGDDGFTPMFNGKDLTGWQTTGNWVVEKDGSISLHPRPGERGWQRYGAYLTTARKYRDFILDLEFKINKRGNSGVFLRVGDPKSQVNSGFEVQILDTHGKAKPTAHDCGGVIGTASPAKNMAKPAGEWNRYTITCVGSQLKVVLNGEQIIDLDLSTSRLKDRPPSGYIGFQDEAKRVWYRNVRIKELTAQGKTSTDPPGPTSLAPGRRDRRLADRPPSGHPSVAGATGKELTQTMFYKAKAKETGNMWDTWLYLHEGTYYLYYLAKSAKQWDNISLATSPDGVHWREHGRVLAKAEGVTWMGTGSTWKSPTFATDGKFIMNFSEWRGPRQTIFFAESTDLVNWKRLSGECEFTQDERWYEPTGRWDCIWTIPRPGGGMYGYWTATPKNATGGRFGFGETLDGVHWKALEPPKVHGVGVGEVGAIEKIGGRYIMMFGSHGAMVTLTAEKPEGPFHAAKTNFRFLTGHTYFSRFFATPGGMLVNHHSIARDGQVSFAPLKAAAVDAAGTFRLGWWKGNETMKHASVEVQPAPEGDAPIAMLGNTFDVEGGLILEGVLALPTQKGAPRRGLYIECGADSGSAILINTAGLAELGSMKADGSGFKAVKRVDRKMAFGTPAAFRLLLRDSLLEFYLDDILIECFSLPAVATGRIGLIGGRGSDAISDLRAWQ